MRKLLLPVLLGGILLATVGCGPEPTITSPEIQGNPDQPSSQGLPKPPPIPPPPKN